MTDRIFCHFGLFFAQKVGAPPKNYLVRDCNDSQRIRQKFTKSNKTGLSNGSSIADFFEFSAADFSNRVPENSDYVTYKNTEVSSQTDQQNINNIQTSTASSNYHEKENDENHKIRNFSQPNSKTCDKIHVNKNTNNNTKGRELLDQAYKKSESEGIIEQSNPNTLHKKRPCTIIVGDSTVKHLHGKCIANKTSRDNIILVKPFPGARTKAMKHYVSPDSEKSQTWLFYILAPTTLNLSVHLKRLPMKSLH